MQIIRTAIIGQGRSGRDIHAAQLSRDPDHYRIAAVVDALPERRARAREEYGCEVFEDYKPLLGRDDLDLVVNASPSKFHVPVTLEFLEAGHNVLCEKPLASNVADVDRLIAASKTAGKTLAIFQQSRYAPYYRKIREVIDSGVLGEIIQISIAFNGFSRRYDWQTLSSEMGGNLLNTGPHPIDQALQLFGADVTPKVTCFRRCAISYGDAEDHALVILTGKGRPIIQIEISSVCRYPRDTYLVYATHGGLRSDTKRVEWQYYDPDKAPDLKLTTSPIQRADGTPAYCSDSLEWHTEEWQAPKDVGLFEGMASSFYAMLYRTLTAGEPLEITPQQVRQQIAVIEECLRRSTDE
ncbi:MAG TPA: Gfo/Idh/MocA family oxidoreductase [Armatimonadota bacterium]|nr:Gfo/Idh/MocA family oxidoreductase [Armatimonadota bacterium]